VGGPEVFIESLGYAGYALEKWHMRGKFLGLLSPAGKREIWRIYMSGITDPISDMLTRIRNGGIARLTSVDIPYSKFKAEIAEILDKEGYIKSYEIHKDEGAGGIIRVYLKYGKNRKCSISGLKRISKPGLRVYVRKDEIPKALGGFGTVILSTSKGVLTDKDAKKQQVGGEVICFIW